MFGSSAGFPPIFLIVPADEGLASCCMASVFLPSPLSTFKVVGDAEVSFINDV